MESPYFVFYDKARGFHQSIESDICQAIVERTSERGLRDLTANQTMTKRQEIPENRYR
jgi:hypothetical protein